MHPIKIVTTSCPAVHSYVTRGLGLTLLAPEIVEAILKSWQGRESMLAHVLELFLGDGLTSAGDSCQPHRASRLYESQSDRGPVSAEGGFFEKPALLKGLLFGPDGAAFSSTHTRKGGRLYRYYVSQTVLKHGAGSCPVGRVPAGEIEAAVIDQLRAVFRQPEIVVGTWKAARTLDDDITEADASAALQQLDRLWDELFPAEQARIVALLVERVDVGTNGLNVRLRVDWLGGLAREMLAGNFGAAA